MKYGAQQENIDFDTAFCTYFDPDNNNIKVFEKDFLIEDVYNADEAFVTGTFSGIIPVAEIDGHQFNIGPLTKRLFAIYKEDIENL